MITSLRLVNFKNFADETLHVGPFTVIVGANASGKSNIRDAFRFLHGIGRGYTLAEIFGGKREAGWQPIRGAMNEIIRFGQSSFSVEVEMNVESGLASSCFMIEIGVDSKSSGFQLRTETLHVVYKHGSRFDLYKPDPNQSHAAPAHLLFSPYVYDEDQGLRRPFPAWRDRPALMQLGEHERFRPKHREYYWWKQVIDIFANMRFLDLSPQRMREPAFPGATVLGDSGENLPVVLRDICTDPEREKILTSWIAELTPMDVTGFEFPTDPSGRVHLTLCEANGRKVSAYSASDGTLRFLAMLAALLGDNPSALYFFEEMDAGIHPARQWLLLDLIEKQAAKRGIQVVTTTHSPDLLTFVNDSTFEHLSVVCRLEDSHDAIIRPVAKLPNAEELRTAQGGLGRLLSSRWMETALAFTEDYDETEDGP